MSSAQLERATWLLRTGLIGALFALAASCQVDLEIEARAFKCESPSDCAPGYQCRHVADATAKQCVRGGSTEDAGATDTRGDVDPRDGGSDADLLDASDGQDIESDVACNPSPESCDGLDNDCDDGVDEDFDQKGDNCTVGQGACAASGQLVCSSDGTGLECSAVPGEPEASELCGNAIDDDCDGDINEDCACVDPTSCGGTDTSCGCDTCTDCTALSGWYPTGAAYNCCDGMQACSCQDEEQRFYTCNNEGSGCQMQVLDTRTTISGCVSCNDSEQCTIDSCKVGVCVNENDDNFSDTCYSGPIGTAWVGTCREGSWSCINGSLTSCQAEVLPTAEFCGDGVDSDCDGATDDSDCNHILFATSDQYDGLIGSLSNADRNCQDSANAAGLSGTFKAVISDSSTNASQRITLNGSVFNTNGNLLASSPQEFWSNLQQGVGYDESGQRIFSGTEAAWTGTLSGGTAAGNNCASWNSRASGAMGRTGLVNSGGSNWLDNTDLGCETTRRLYCISQFVSN